MKIKKLFWYVFFPLLGGLIIGSIILFIKPEFGRSVGTNIYNSNREVVSYSYAVANSAPSVVNIYVTRLNKDYSFQNNDNMLITSASGVIMRQDGFIVTNYHVITSVNEPNTTIYAQTRDGAVYPAFVIGYDRRTDLAVLKIDAQNLHTIPIDNDYEPQEGDVVLAIGNPNNLGQTVTHGIISATARTGSGLLTKDQMDIRVGLQDLIQTDAPINNGNSGGALVNTNGQLVGINTASFNGYQAYGISFAVPTKLVVYVMNEIITHGRVIRGYLGIADAGTANVGDKDNSVGVLVGYIDPNSPADIANLKVNDIIIGVNGKKINSLRALMDIIANTKPGQIMNFSVYRNHQIIQIPIKLVEDKADI